MILRTSSLGKATVLGLASLFAFTGCSPEQTDSSTQEAENIGQIGLNLTLPGGATVATVNYSITGNGITPITGSVDVSQEGATASFLRSLPAGSGYTVTLTAVTSRNGDCLGSATFDVLAQQTTTVNVLLQCTDETTDGEVLVNGTLNVCPRVSSISAAPITVQVGGIITLAAAAVDADSDAITTAWTATAGTFANGAALNTSYTCTVAGPQTLTLTATDARACARSRTVGVTCTGTTPVVCGNSVVQAGETCDDGNTTAGDGCSATCQIEPRCGDAIVNQASEQCDDGNTVNTDACSNTCQAARCGDAIVNQASEQCDDGNSVDTDACSNACQNVIVAAVCGNGTVETGEQCDDGNTADLDGCSPTCRTTVTVNAACRTCQDANCTAFPEDGIDLVERCYNAEGVALAGPGAGRAKRDLCLELVDCAHRTDCADTSADACYCGTVDFNTCTQTGGNGACRAQFEAAAESTVPDVLTSRSSDLSFAIGPSYNLLICESIFSCTAACAL